MKSFIISISIIILRTCFLIYYTSNLNNIYNIFYLIIYILFIIPLKLYGIISIQSNHWITSNRKFLSNFCSLDILFMYLFIFLWNFLLITGSLRILFRHFHYIPKEIFFHSNVATEIKNVCLSIQ